MIPSFSFLGRTFTIYPLMALAGIFVAGIYACRAAKRAGQNEDDMIMLLLISSFGVFLGMHLLYGLVGIPQWSAQMDQIHGLASFFQAMVAMWGGSVFYGGLLGGLLAGACYLRQTSRSLGLWSSLAAPAIPLFHIFGRIGCFLGGCCYGLPSAWGLSTDTVRLLRPTGLSAFRCSWWKRPGIWCSSCSWPGYSGGESPICCPCIWSSIPPPGFCWSSSEAMHTGESSWGCPPPNGSACFSSPPPCTPSCAEGINKDFTPGPFPFWGFVVYLWEKTTKFSGGNVLC